VSNPSLRLLAQAATAAERHPVGLEFEPRYFRKWVIKTPCYVCREAWAWVRGVFCIFLSLNEKRWGLFNPQPLAAFFYQCQIQISVCMLRYEVQRFFLKKYSYYRVISTIINAPGTYHVHLPTHTGYILKFWIEQHDPSLQYVLVQVRKKS